MTTIGEALVPCWRPTASTPCSAFPACIRSNSTADLQPLESAMSRRATSRAPGSWPMAMRGCQRPAGRRHRHHRARPHQYDYRDGAGALRFRADAGDFGRQCRRDPRQGFWLSARTARPARPDGKVWRSARPDRGGPAELPPTLNGLRAVQHAAGPVHVEIPPDVMGKAASAWPAVLGACGRRRPLPEPSRPWRRRRTLQLACSLAR